MHGARTDANWIIWRRLPQVVSRWKDLNVVWMKSLRKTDQWVDKASWVSPQDAHDVTWRARLPALDFLRVSVVALGTAAFWMLLIWAIHRQSPRTLVSFHGFIHAAIADKFIETAMANFPPENPFFAGSPVAFLMP